MDASLDHHLRERPIEHALLCTYHEQIDKLIRMSVSGLLFEVDRTHFLARNVTQVIESLLECLRKTYGSQHKTLLRAQASQLTQAIEELAPLVRSDVEAALVNDPATDDPLEVIFCYPGFKAIAAHRIAHVFYRQQLPLLPRMVAERAHESTGIDIHPGAQIGEGFFIDHGTGIVIGETAIIGKGVTLYQGVTLGAKRFARDASGTVIKGQPRHPILEDGVTVYAGATILGRITIGARSVIGGNVWVTESLPPQSRVTQQRYLTNLFQDGDGI